ncbi:nuclear RNA export factor 1-like [Antedon mediterranea]|uniref:nuclear RNA export factor 1-like n=1 Tax=Antedon mediterranea TaxID=105859 RepID=UPI003AF459FE
MSRGYGKGRGGFSVTASRDGGRSFYQHDDRQGGSSHVPEGHWRGGPPRGRGAPRGESSGGRGGRGRGYYGSDNYYQGGQGSYRGDYSSGGKWRGSRGSRGSRSRGGPRYPRRDSNRGSAPPSSSKTDDEDVVMEEEGKKQQQRRYTPYGGRNDRGSSRHRNDRPKRGKGGPSSSKRNDMSWVEIQIPHGKKVEKQWLLQNLQEKCSTPFVPLDYHYKGEFVIFYVDDQAAGAALKELTRQITAPSGHKVIILTKFCAPPSWSMTPEKLEALKTGMSNRYDPSTKSLDLGDIYNDKGLQQEKLYIELHKAVYMDAVLKIIVENIPEIQSLSVSKCVMYSLKTLEGLAEKLPNLKIIDVTHNKLKRVKELECLKGLKLEELKLEGNPLCDFYKDKTDYVSDIRQIFPTVLRLDGVVLPPPIAFELDESTALPPVKASFFVSDEVKALVVPFVEKFFSVFDSGDRQLLLDAYHEQACFSLSIPNSSSRTNRTNLGSFNKYSRNLFKVKDSGQRFKLLKQSRLSVTAFLKDLPGTQHDIASFIVDVSLAQGTLLLFTVDGVFKEVESRNSNPQIIAFSRIFLTHFDNRLVILNDELILKCPTENQIKAAFPSAAPTPSHSPVLQSSSGPSENEKMIMVTQFIKDSGMNVQYSKMCLEETQWDYQRAGKLFSEMKAQGNISKEAFQQ